MVKLVYIVFYVIIMDEVDVIELVVFCICMKLIVEKKGMKVIYLLFIVKVLVVVFC